MLCRSLQGSKRLAQSVQAQARRQGKSKLHYSTASNEIGRRRGIQAWQAFLVGSLATISVQGAILYSQTPPASSSSSSASAPKTAPVRDLQKALNSIAAAGIEVSTAEDVLTGFATAPGTFFPPSLPLAVVYPQTTEDVVAIVNACRATQVPMIPISGRTSLEGSTIALQEKGSAIMVSLDRMDKIIEINEMNGDAVVQAGVTWEGLNEYLADRQIDLFFPVDPGPGACFGGMISCGGSGTGAVRYGTMKAEWVINATVVLATGEVIKTRSRARKSSMGWDVTKMFIGAEGTLGIVTECTVRLAPKVPIKVATTAFSNVDDAVKTVIELLNRGVQVTCVELIDGVGMKAVNMSGQISRKYPETPHLFIKFSGGPGTISDNVKTTSEILKKNRGKPLVIAKNDEENEEIWQARKGLYFSQQLLVPGCKVYVTDACVPLSKLPELVRETSEDIQNSGFISPIIGHAGDGNIHAALLYRPDQDYEAVKALARRISHRAISMGGTASGEHGVGQSKRQFMEADLGRGTVSLMRSIKRTLDPDDLFNPGKVLPDETT